MKLTDKIPALPKLLMRIVGYCIAAAIAYALIHGFAMFRIAHHTEDCSAATGRSSANQSPLKRAKSMAACIARHSSFPENLFFDSTLQMLASLPNAPCKYVGIWTSTRPGSVYKISMADSGMFTAEFVTGKGPEEPVSGSWGAWRDNLVWFYDQGTVWPPDANPIVNDEPDRFTLIERNGSRTQFTRLDSVESRICGTSGIKIGADSGNGQIESQTDTSALLPKTSSAPALSQWAGKYVIPAQPGDAMLIAVSASGQFTASFPCLPAKGGAKRTATETGYLALAEEWYQVNADGINAADACRLPSRFYPLQWGGQRYLLADTQLTALVNRINAGQPVESGAMLQAAEGKNSLLAVWPASPLPPLPKPYSDGIVPQPLQGELSAIGTIGAASPYALMQSKAGNSEYRTKATLNLGSRQGVFNGMQFYAAQGPDSLRVEVVDTRLEQADVRLNWKGEWKPRAGLAVSSRPARP